MCDFEIHRFIVSNKMKHQNFSSVNSIVKFFHTRYGYLQAPHVPSVHISPTLSPPGLSDIKFGQCTGCVGGGHMSNILSDVSSYI